MLMPYGQGIVLDNCYSNPSPNVVVIIVTITTTTTTTIMFLTFGNCINLYEQDALYIVRFKDPLTVAYS